MMREFLSLKLRLAALCLALIAPMQAGRYLPALPGEEVADGLIVRLRDGGQLRGAKVPSRYMASSRWRAMQMANFHVVQVDPSEHRAVGEALASDPAVDFVEPDRIRKLHIAAPNDPRYAEQWNLAMIRAREAWQWMPGRYLSSTSNLQRVRVAILDSGADCTHPDFANAGNSSTSHLNGGQLNWFESSAWQWTSIESPACQWQDDNGHGTAMAGIVGAAAN